MTADRVRSGYVFASEIGWEDYFPTYKQFVNFLEKTPEIRWYNAMASRRAVHVADWKKYWNAHTEKRAELLDLRPEVLDAIATAQRRKQERERRKRQS